MKELWTEKYRPRTVADYVFKDPAQKRQVESWIQERSIPHLLFSGTAGIGKTTLAKVLIHDLEISEFDVLEINASRENNVETVREKIINFVQMIPLGDFKVVLLDEADYFTPNAQAILRGVMETYSNFSRFILTCNYPSRIIPALHSRCQGFHFTKTDITEYTARIATVLVSENIDFDLDVLDTYVKIAYPDFRKCLNLTQQHIVNNQLEMPGGDSESSADYKIDMVALFKKGKILEARTLLCGRARPEEIPEIFTWMYQNLDLFGKTDEAKDKALQIIKQGLLDHAIIADPEINLAATLSLLARLK